MADDRELLVWEAKFAEQTERYDKMLELMKQIAKLGTELTTEERQLFSAASKHTVGRHRNAWRVICAAEEEEDAEGNENHLSLVKEYRSKEETDILTICRSIIDIIDQHLLPASTQPESNVYCYKMKGDHFRFIAEVASSPKQNKEATEEGLIAYQTGTNMAQTDLPKTDPLRLGLALNFAVFYYEILNQPEKAIQLAKSAMDDAIAIFDTLSEDSMKETESVLQLLNDNITLWREDLVNQN